MTDCPSLVRRNLRVLTDITASHRPGERIGSYGTGYGVRVRRNRRLEFELGHTVPCDPCGTMFGWANRSHRDIQSGPMWVRLVRPSMVGSTNREHAYIHEWSTRKRLVSFSKFGLTIDQQWDIQLSPTWARLGSPPKFGQTSR